MEQFGERLSFLRQAKGMSRAELARAAYVTRITIHRYEEKMILPSAYVLRNLSLALNVPSDVLLGLRALTKEEAEQIVPR